MKRNKYLLLLIICIGIAFSYIATNLSISGRGLFGKSNWNIYFDDIRVLEGRDFVVSNPMITNNTNLNFSINLPLPGDCYKFYVDIVNDGDVDAMINLISNSNIDSRYAYFNISYFDGLDINEKDLLKKKSREVLSIEVGYKEDIDLDTLVMDKEIVNINISLEYKIADSTSHEVNHELWSFNDTEWEDVVKYAKLGIYPYQIGDTKCIHLDGFTSTNDNGCNGDFKVRVANTSTPDECYDGEFSQTACGFVLEFEDILDRHVIDSEYNLDGGWGETNIREYLNTDIYNSMPDVIKDNIKETYVLSSHAFEDWYGSSYYSLWESIDKLYLLSAGEIWSDDFNNLNTLDNSTERTRQLDYYSNLGVSFNNYNAVVKKFHNYDSFWWLRSIDSTRTKEYLNYLEVSNIGNFGYESVSSYSGVSPAFRLGPIKLNQMSWDEIAECARSGSCDLEIGDYKCIPSVIGFTVNNNSCPNFSFRVRLANISTPMECMGDNFSQSACGLVLEFQDIINDGYVTYDSYSPYGKNEINKGGWPSYRIRSYLNNDIYEDLPDDLKRNIIDTYVISGYGLNDNNGTGPGGNWESIDKLYLLSATEIWRQGTSKTIDYDSARNYTRQLDYYSKFNVTTNSNTEVAIKRFDGNSPYNWATRTPYSNNNKDMYDVDYNGIWKLNRADGLSCFAPAFRVG